MDRLVTAELPRSFFKVRGGTFRLKPVGSYFQSPFAPQVIRMGAARFMRWECSLELAVLERAAWQRFEAWMATIADQPFAFKLHDTAKELPLGAGAGFDPDGTELTVTGSSTFSIPGGLHAGATHCKLRDAAARHATSVVVKGMPVSSRVFKAGDHVEIGGNLYMVRGDVLSDAEGAARIDIMWRLHKPALANDLVTFRNPTGRFMIPDLSVGEVMRDTATHGQASLAAVEVPYT